jgi:hypothetical protein
MDDRITIASSESILAGGGPCTKQFRLHQLQPKSHDKLGHLVEDILWVGRSYVVYRSEKGVYVQFSDDPEEEATQRRRFTEVCPELCELRYFTPQIRSTWNFPFGSQDRSSLFDHNIAQAIMLVMEGRVDTGKQIAEQALKMAVIRVTNDNTIRYALACLMSWFAWIVLGILVFALLLLFSPSSHLAQLYVVAGVSGATGAMLSVATRLQAFRLQPCNQSNMNYYMSAIRVGTGLIAGLALLLLAPSILSTAMQNLVPKWGNPPEWESAAALGLVAGFAERLIPNMMRWTAGQMEPSFGTPAQAVRNEEMQRESHKSMSPPAGK